MMKQKLNRPCTTKIRQWNNTPILNIIFLKGLFAENKQPNIVISKIIVPQEIKATAIGFEKKDPKMYLK